MDGLHLCIRCLSFEAVLLFIYEPRVREHYCQYEKRLILSCLQILGHQVDKITRGISAVDYLRYLNASKMFISLTKLCPSLLADY